ncbi:MAG TPA: lipid-A-disaccharide synthase [Verrucomicrobia bacterium]|nr:MAG: lipid-A-disaccharide synthase [Lentisphaerae bacterium GWF2_57_35]HBA85506.1 lipid-A-disaccharide synthase [Verrucomicrobiota bacterium]
MRKSVLVIAGEISGDMHAARLVQAVRAKNPDIDFWGIGGDRMREAGVETLYDVRDMAVLGLAEVLRRYGFFKKVFDCMVGLARERRPDLVLLVDYPGFNLRLAQKVHAMGIKVVYYICPQVWAWHRSRIPKMARMVDRLLVIFPFEVDVFAGTGLRTDFVGHPLVGEARRVLESPLKALPWPGEPRVALLPGSRRQEIERILPVMWAAAARLEKDVPGIGFVIAAPSEEVAGLVRERLASLPAGPSRVEVLAGETRQVLRQAKAAMVASGTATVETALMGCPMLVVYKTALLTYWIGRQLIRVPFLGMVNIVAGRALCPEFIQGAATPEALAEAIKPLLSDTPQRIEMVAGLRQVAQALGREHGDELAGDILLEELGSKP